MMKKRNSNIELLRIISILMIVVSHYTVHNGISNSTLPLGFNRFLLEITTLGNIGTILFILITGYYLINSDKGLKFSKIFKLWLQIFFYSILIYFIFVILKLEPFSIKSLIKSIFPITFKKYWFATCYIILYLFHPFINKLINSLNQSEHLKLILTSLLFSLLYTITTQDFYANELIQFIMFYIIGSYFGKYKNTIFKSHKTNIILLLSSSIILILSVIAFDIIGTKTSLLSIESTFLLNRNSIVTILFAISLFNIFANKKEFCNNLINIISSLVFGVYLISDNHYVRYIIWNDIFKNHAYVSSNYLIIHLIITVTVVFIVCLIIEFIRKNTLDRFYDKFVSNKVHDIQTNLEKKYDKFIKKLN